MKDRNCPCMISESQEKKKKKTSTRQRTVPMEKLSCVCLSQG